MTLSDQELRHNLHWGPAVYFPLPGALDRRTFWRICEILAEQAGPSRTASREEHWSALEDRAAGRSRWDRVVPGRKAAPETAEERQSWAESVQSAAAILKHRAYTSHRVDGIEYVVDLFNPGNELEIAYSGAGHTVVALLLGETELDPRLVSQTLPIRDRLADTESFYRVVSGLMTVLSPVRVCGGSFLGRVILSYHSGRMSMSTGPWDLLWTLTAIPTADVERMPQEALRKAFCRTTEVRARHMTLLQVTRGFDSVLSREYVAAASVVGRVSVAQV